MKIVIPARRNSKGLPFKNRKLINETLKIIPDSLKDSVIISTDDEYIVDIAQRLKIKVLGRTKELASDTASIKSVLLDIKISFM